MNSITVNAAGKPCTAALNHVMVDDRTLVFHGALRGEKIENIKKNPNVSFFVVGAAEVVADRFTTIYTSAVAHGTAVIVEDSDEDTAAAPVIPDCGLMIISVAPPSAFMNTRSHIWSMHFI